MPRHRLTFMVRTGTWNRMPLENLYGFPVDRLFTSLARSILLGICLRSGYEAQNRRHLELQVPGLSPADMSLILVVDHLVKHNEHTKPPVKHTVPCLYLHTYPEWTANVPGRHSDKHAAIQHTMKAEAHVLKQTTDSRPRKLCIEVASFFVQEDSR
ncbi:hypothetical protein IFM46972_04418 [Aspergillus udagawae]|uniref:Uncharacterized protein n=1 Tax=Aspergillus udagawae TaxID=91492 RepID=A0A8H3NJN8_9EURO|nr:hypothetical protein IFM46972_04418 [Aspergillus udagawae]